MVIMVALKRLLVKRFKRLKRFRAGPDSAPFPQYEAQRAGVNTLERTWRRPALLRVAVFKQSYQVPLAMQEA